MKALIDNIKQYGKQILYEENTDCLLCGKSTGPICPDCNQKYFLPMRNRCKNCGKIISNEYLCRDCLSGNGPKGLLKVTAWGVYEGAWKDFIWAIKFRSQPYRLKEVARPLSEWAINNLPPVDGMVPIPIHYQREAERGFNQAEVISSILHWELGLPILRVLERTENTDPQVGLTRGERLINLEGTIQAKQPVSGYSIWLIDDVTTTGATLEAGAKALYKAGAKEVYGLCLAAGIEKPLVTPVF